MRKISLIVFMIVIFSTGITSGQSFDWNLRGGLNVMKSRTSGEKVSTLYHAGMQAGIRIARLGFYGEALYSVLENQNSGGDPIPYFAPSVIFKIYWQKYIFSEIGGTYISKIGDSGSNDQLNPDSKVFMVAGIGAHISKFELSVRFTPEQTYGLIQLTAALKF
jgi:hypothetical protein